MSNKTLVIAEKPAVAADLARVLNVPKKNDFFESDTHVIYSAVGHCVELEYPEDIDPALRHWRLDTLPILPEHFGLKASPNTRERLSRLKQLLHRKDVGCVVNACDAGREGELIFAYIYQFTNSRLPVRRAWMQTMTADGIRAAFAKLRDGAEMAGLEDAARCRSESDWLIGMNGTRAVTKRMFGGGSKGNIATVGRVQTPTLAIVVKREREIRAFVPRELWRITGDFSVANGNYIGVFQRPDFKKDNAVDEHDRADRVWNETSANAIADAARTAKSATVSDEKKAATQMAPRLYDLTSLQREANSRFGLPAKRTLQIAQSLYERHKVLTYPRTDSRALPEDYISTCKQTLGKLTGDLEQHAQKALDENFVRPNKRIFNNAQISDHFAIIPTGLEPRDLDDIEAKIYDMVARRFVAAFYPPAEFDVTTRTSSITPATPLKLKLAAGDAAPLVSLPKLDFKSEGRVLTNPGWLAVYGKGAAELGADDAAGKSKKDGGENSASANLPALDAADGKPPAAKIAKINLVKEATKPPPRYSEATLLSAMEGAGKLVEDEELGDAMKERGLGTPATRAEIIEGLLAQKYLERPAGKRELAPTQKAETLLDFLAAVGADALTKPDMTGEWEFKLRQMEHGKFARKTFMDEIVNAVKAIVEGVKKFSENPEDAEVTDIPSPSDGKPLLSTLRSYKSQDGKVIIYKVVSGRKFTDAEVRTLCENGEVGPFDDFVSPRTGNRFTAKVRLGEDPKKQGVKRTEFDFGEKTTTGELTPFWDDTKTKSQLCEAATDYILREPTAGGEWKEIFKVGRFLCKKELTREDAILLVTQGKTNLIEGFTSKKGRPFNAFLLRDGHRIRWEFPPRAPRAGKGAAADAAAGDDAAAAGATGTGSKKSTGRKRAADSGTRAKKSTAPASPSDAALSAKATNQPGTARNQRNQPLDLNTAENLGPAGVEFPKATLFRTADAYHVVRDYDIAAGDPHSFFRVSRVLCQKEVPVEEIRKLCQFGRTELITDFISKRGRPFSAFLTISKDRSKADFEFPPRD